ncbi:OmpH family outer membrane protein [Flavobacterium collinsii]|mgnify:CR=1 FL=1|uniref:OmpH family outer membrane protein n=1 Tax=Flavobacterium collinsii TaxID=1114861 RepID=UPI00375788F1
MVKNKSSLLLIFNSLLIFALIFYVIFTHFTSRIKIVYVSNVELFDGFAMTKELKRTGEKEFNTRKTALDNLYARIQSKSITDSEKESLMKEFIKAKEELEQFNQVFASNESQKIWSRIHNYTEDFSKENGYQLIIGSDNKTNVLYADEKITITKELLTYINKRYEGLR